MTDTKLINVAKNVLGEKRWSKPKYSTWENPENSYWKDGILNFTDPSDKKGVMIDHIFFKDNKPHEIEYSTPRFDVHLKKIPRPSNDTTVAEFENCPPLEKIIKDLMEGGNLEESDVSCAVKSLLISLRDNHKEISKENLVKNNASMISISDHEIVTATIRIERKIRPTVETVETTKRSSKEILTPRKLTEKKQISSSTLWDYYLLF